MHELTKLIDLAVVKATTWRRYPRPGAERGLSQSTENAVLLTGAVAIALTVIGLVGGYVARQLGALG